MKHGMSSRTLTIVIVVIACVWSGSMAAEVFVPTFDSPDGINEIMMAMVGFLFAGRQVAAESEKKNGDKAEDEAK